MFFQKLQYSQFSTVYFTDKIRNLGCTGMTRCDFQVHCCMQSTKLFESIVSVEELGSVIAATALLFQEVDGLCQRLAV